MTCNLCLYPTHLYPNAYLASSSDAHLSCSSQQILDIAALGLTQPYWGGICLDLIGLCVLLFLFFSCSLRFRSSKFEEFIRSATEQFSSNLFAIFFVYKVKTLASPGRT
jgi:hypothetical protein